MVTTNTSAPALAMFSLNKKVKRTCVKKKRLKKKLKIKINSPESRSLLISYRIFCTLAWRMRKRRIFFSKKSLFCKVGQTCRMSASKALLSVTEIKAAVERLSGEAVRILSDLVRFRSLTGTPEELKAQEYVEALLRDWGFQIKRIAIPPAKLEGHPGYSPVDWQYPSERVNVVGSWVPRALTGRSLAINGHIDVVPVEEATEERWTTGPFEPAVREGRLYGRRAGDMKGGFVAGPVALRALRGPGYSPAGRLEYHSVIEEECSGNGALAVVLDGAGSHCADAVLIPEPLPGILSAQLGVLWCSVEDRKS